jgi:hypothetical protein
VPAPIIADEHVGLRQGGHQLSLAPIPVGDRQCLEESGEPEIESGQAFTAGCMAQGIAEPGFPKACRPGDQDVVMLPHPLAGGETGDQGLVQAPGRPVVAIVDAGRLTPCGLASAGAEPTLLPCGAFAVHQAPEACFAAAGGDMRRLHLLDEGVSPSPPGAGLGVGRVWEARA